MTSQFLLMLTCQRQVPMKQEAGSTGRLLGPKGLLSHAESGDEKSIWKASANLLFDSKNMCSKLLNLLLDSTVGWFIMVTYRYTQISHHKHC